eukprot:4448288-Pyramimonas_sp.AAC.1
MGSLGRARSTVCLYLGARLPLAAGREAARASNQACLALRVRIVVPRGPGSQSNSSHAPQDVLSTDLRAEMEAGDAGGLLSPPMAPRLCRPP